MMMSLTLPSAASLKSGFPENNNPQGHHTGCGSEKSLSRHMCSQVLELV